MLYHLLCEAPSVPGGPVPTRRTHPGPQAPLEGDTPSPAGLDVSRECVCEKTGSRMGHLPCPGDRQACFRRGDWRTPWGLRKETSGVLGKLTRAQGRHLRARGSGSSPQVSCLGSGNLPMPPG